MSYALRLELCLDDIERTGRNAGDETAAGAGCEGNELENKYENA